MGITFSYEFILLLLGLCALLILVSSYRLGVAVRRIRIQRAQINKYQVEILALRVELEETIEGRLNK